MKTTTAIFIIGMIWGFLPDDVPFFWKGSIIYTSGIIVGLIAKAVL